MKSTSGFLAIGAGVVLSFHQLHAQTAWAGSLDSDAVAAATGEANTIVQAAADACGLKPVAPEDLMPCGTFWVIMPDGSAVPFPCLPPQPGSIFTITDNIYLVDGLGDEVVTARPGGRRAAKLTVAEVAAAEMGAVVNLINQVQDAEFNRDFATEFGLEEEMDSGGPSFGFSAAMYSPGDLWLEVAGMDPANQLADLLVHNT